jgi:hypothetical protein
MLHEHEKCLILVDETNSRTKYEILGSQGSEYVSVGFLGSNTLKIDGGSMFLQNVGIFCLQVHMVLLPRISTSRKKF